MSRVTYDLTLLSPCTFEGTAFVLHRAVCLCVIERLIRYDDQRGGGNQNVYRYSTFGWGSKGVKSSAVDPGAVFSNLWLNDAFFGSPPVNAILSALYAPPKDGAKSVVTASLAPFARTTTAVAAAAVSSGSEKSGHGAAADDDDARFRFYARGLFASSFVAKCAPGNRGGGTGVGGALRECGWNAQLGLWGLGTLACSLLDWPVRRCSKGAMAGATAEVPSSPSSYNTQLAIELWDEAEKAAGLSHQ